MTIQEYLTEQRANEVRIQKYQTHDLAVKRLKSCLEKESLPVGEIATLIEVIKTMEDIL